VRQHLDRNTDALLRGGFVRSTNEVSVMEMEGRDKQATELGQTTGGNTWRI